LVRRQHGVIARGQLLELGLSTDAIAHRIKVGRLHPLWRGVYAVGRPTVGRCGRLMAASLRCGPEALLSHGSAASLWGLLSWQDSIDVVVPYRTVRRPPGIRVHRRVGLDSDGRRVITGIPVTDPINTLIDLSRDSSPGLLERAIREADRLDLVDPESLRRALDSSPGGLA
jgi:hypothetical protein